MLPGALEGVRVLEFSEAIAAPLAGMLLGDLGADVIKIEPRGGESGRLIVPSAHGENRGFLAFNRNKRGIAVDLKTPEGQAIVQRLVPTVDVVIVTLLLHADDQIFRPANGFDHDEAGIHRCVPITALDFKA